MATYTELITKIDDAFQTGKKLKITAREIEYLTTDEINSLQQRINNHNFQCINQAAKKGMIDDDAAAWWPDCEHGLPVGIERACRPGQLQRGKGRFDRGNQGFGSGSCGA